MNIVASTKYNLCDIYFWNMKMADGSENFPERKVKCDFNQICIGMYAKKSMCGYNASL